MREDIVHFYVPQIKVPFYMEMAGISYCDGTYRMKRQESAETVLKYIVDGRGYINVDGENYAATKGDVYILRKKTSHTYWSDAKSPWVKIFFNIRGSLAEKILDEYKLGTSGKVVLNGEGLEQDFREMLARVSDNSIGQAERFEVPLKKLWVVMLIITFMIPADVIMIPRYILFNTFQMIGSPLSMIIPAALGQGLKSSIFVLIFMQAFASVPKSFDEAAQLDGAGRIRVFFKIALPMAVPSIVLCIIFSLVWYWNETAQTAMLVGSDFQTLPLQLQSFDALFGASFSTSFGDEANRLNERYQFAATLLTIVPLMLFYFVMQKQFVKGIESAGITGE